MNKQKPPKENDFEFEFDMLYKINSVASATECTGLIQIPPNDEEEADSYTDIYVVPKQVNYREHELRKWKMMNCF